MPDYRIGAYNIREYNVGILKQYADDYYKLVNLRSVRKAGYEDSSPSPVLPAARCAANNKKLSNNLSRARSAVYALARCNPWSYFITLTLDPSKVDRNDLKAAYRKLAKWINNYNSRHNCKVLYLLVPEPHKDGAWHFHGLLSGLPLDHLTAFSVHDHIPRHLKLLLQAGRQLYNWPAYAESFGFVTVDAIRDIKRCSAYMTKYITKELLDSSIELNYHVYYCSKGLQRPEIIYRGQMQRPIEKPDFSNDYVTLKCFPSVEEALLYFCDLEVLQWKKLF